MRQSSDVTEKKHPFTRQRFKTCSYKQHVAQCINELSTEPNSNDRSSKMEVAAVIAERLVEQLTVRLPSTVSPS